MLRNKKLLDSSSEDSDDGETKLNDTKSKYNGSELKINKNYAQRYDKWRSSEEAQKLKDRYGADVLEDDDSESSSSEDSDLHDEEKEKEFLRTLSLLRKKDSSIYDESRKFFADKNTDKTKKSEVKKEDSIKGNKKESKPYLLKDHDREMVLRKQTDESGDEEEKVDDKNVSKQGLPYYQELSNIKKGFSDVLKDIDSDEEDETLLRKRIVTASEKEKEEKDYRLWLKGQVKDLDEKDKDVKEMQHLKDIWSSPTLPEDEKFLRDYVLNRGYDDPDEGKNSEYIPTYDEIIHDSDEGGLSGDEKFEEERENFEHKYNFRYEEPDQDFIKRYPRTVAESLRRADEKRKKQRELLKEKRDSKLERKREEIQRLKSIKRKEILEKLQKLQEITGDPHLPVNDIDIEGDFDPDEHDRRMNQLFNDNYYGNPDEDKPVFPSDEELDEVNWEEWMPEGEEDKDEEPEPDSSTSKKKRKKRKYEEQAAACEDPDFNMDADFAGPSTSKGKRLGVVDELIEASKGRNRKLKPSVFLSALERKKPKFDPSVHESFQQYFDDYYNLDFEDLLGDMPCRFKYRKVTPNDFGLTTDEILKAPDRELNQWASVKKTFQYRAPDEELYELQAYQKKSSDVNRKKRILMSLYAEKESEAEEETKTEETESGKSKRKRKKKKKKQKNAPETEVPEPIPNNEDLEEESTQKSEETVSSPVKSKKKKNKKKGATNNSKAGETKKEEDKLVNDNYNESEEKISIKPKKDTSDKGDSQKKAKNKKAFKEKRNQTGTSKPNSLISVDDERLRAYGINPKKFKKRMIYGTSGNHVK